MDIIIIGAGPGGMDTALEARRQGKKVLLIEKDIIGGTCLNRGCIPTKALLHWAAFSQQLHEFKNIKGLSSEHIDINPVEAAVYKNNTVDKLREGAEFSLKDIEIIIGEAILINGHTVLVNEQEYMADKIIIATGSKPAILPIPGIEYTLNSDDVLAWTHEWGENFDSVAIIGGGVIGIEFANIFHALKPETQITIFEYCKEILPPFDKEIAKRLRTVLTRKGIKFVTNAQVSSVSDNNTVSYLKNGKAEEQRFDVIITATGRKPVFPKGLEETGIEFDNKGIKVNDNFQTNIPSVYAIGDVNGRCMLAHAATAQGKKALGENIDCSIIPSAVFSIPECAMVGLTEEECLAHGYNIDIKKALLRSNGKAVCINETEGMIKLIISKDNECLLGAHVCGPHASDIISELTLALVNRLSVQQILRSVHIHPTLSEIIITALNG